MAARTFNLPFLVLLLGMAAVSMFVPAVHAYVVRDLAVARAFFYSGLICLILFGLIAVATARDGPRRRARGYLISLVVTFSAMPVILAVPFAEAVPDTRFLNAYIEMVSSLTTTGATLFASERLPDSVHLWRAQVAWMGGFLVWVSAIAILAPLNLGGFEVLSRGEVGHGAAQQTPIARVADAAERLVRFAWTLGPVYGGLTLLLWLLLYIAGDRPLVAICHAMSTMATSGITPLQAQADSGAGVAGEAMIFVFLFFAISRLTFTRDERSAGVRRLRTDPEFSMGLSCVAVLPMLLFLRHWVGAYEVDDEQNLIAGARAFWGSAFTVLSFLSTTGFESVHWQAARAWSGFDTPGMLLLGLSLVGGGVATTAGGVKLLRVYALYKHGMREMDKLVHPSSIGGAGSTARHIRRHGAYVAWIFFMLFALSVALVALALSLAGASFDEAIILTVAALSTTGPVASVAGEAPIAYASLGDAAKLVVGAAMVLGRLETLAIIALLNPDFWRP